MSLFGRKENVFLRLMKLEETLNFVNALEKLLFIDTFGIQGFKQLIKFDLQALFEKVSKEPGFTEPKCWADPNNSPKQSK